MKLNLKNIVFVSLLALFISCGQKKKEYASFDEYPIRTDDLTEMTYSPAGTKFMIWAPTAEDVRTMLFESGSEGNTYKIIKLEAGEDGVWSGYQEGDLKGKFYTFNVKIKGKWMGDTPGIMAKAVGINGERAAIIRMEDTNPKEWEKDICSDQKKKNCMILYQLNYQEFTADTASGVKNRGKYLALTEVGARNQAGLSTGIDHLKELGITHVQLIPSYDFTGVNEELKDQMESSLDFNPLNYNVPEGSYSTNAHKPEIRIHEFKQMIQAFHKAKIGVIMDVANYMPHATTNCFERTVPGYFCQDNPDNFSHNGMNQKIDQRPMIHKFMIESLRYWMKEYHLDGFCVGKTNSLNVELMNEIHKTLAKEDASLFIYGSGDRKSLNSQPRQMINRLNSTATKSLLNHYSSLTAEEKIRLHKLSQTILFTSQGVPLICSGDEWAVNEDKLKSKNMHVLEWNCKTDGKELFDYCKALISLRKSHPAFRMTSTIEIRDHLESLPVSNKNLKIYHLKEHAGGDQWKDIIVVFNSNPTADKINIPEGKYTVVCRDGMIALSGMGQVYGGQISISKQSALILYK